MKSVQVEAKFVQTQPDGMQFARTSPEHTGLPNGAVSLMPIGFFMLWAIAVMAYLSLSKTKRESTRNTEFNLIQVHKVPCRQCRFYTNNPYLKCAVHPMSAMTKQAIDCSDYQVQIEKTPRK
jgi:hypothetical protein